MYLVDTNVISEARKGLKANPGVKKFFKETDAADIYLSAQTIGEIRRGLENLRYRGDIPQTKVVSTIGRSTLADCFMPTACPVPG